MLAGREIELNGLAVPRVVNTHAVPAGQDPASYRFAEHQLCDAFTIHFDDDLPLLHITFRSPADGDGALFHQRCISASAAAPQLPFHARGAVLYRTADHECGEAWPNTRFVALRRSPCFSFRAARRCDPDHWARPRAGLRR